MEKDWEFFHIGIVVRNLEEAVRYYESIGFVAQGDSLGVSQGQGILTRTTAAHREYKIYGTTPDPPNVTRIWYGARGGLRIQLFTPVSGHSEGMSALEKYGEGAHHACFWVEDLDEEIARLGEQGVSPYVTGVTKIGQKFAHFDTYKYGNFMIEMVERTK